MYLNIVLSNVYVFIDIHTTTKGWRFKEESFKGKIPLIIQALFYKKLAPKEIYAKS